MSHKRRCPGLSPAMAAAAAAAGGHLSLRRFWRSCSLARRARVIYEHRENWTKPRTSCGISAANPSVNQSITNCLTISPTSSRKPRCDRRKSGTQTHVSPVAPRSQTRETLRKEPTTQRGSAQCRSCPLTGSLHPSEAVKKLWDINLRVCFSKKIK